MTKLWCMVHEQTDTQTDTQRDGRTDRNVKTEGSKSNDMYYL